jgi:hypothetical protein
MCDCYLADLMVIADGKANDLCFCRFQEDSVVE